ncbi:helix-turn-helix domain-containing protein [Leisingera sp. M527]|uniref:GlxA family transcriptional regulator n=1 Tax=Leisingera sp. M527 TaxID=2867014 RepID=UPI0021A961A8|nr:helix-turn-helix domain-containing protein [Leisingera sp. M527]UWQ32862.1 helix-turn-helix domain-containing protein [Leisingera sp. M527]
MRSWAKDNAAVQQLDVLLFDAFSAHCLANTVEPLRAANTFAGRRAYAWRFLTLDGRPAVSSSGMEVRAHGKLGDCSGDLLIAMPSYDFLRHATVTAARALKSAAHRYKVIAGFDTGAWLLAEAGLLDRRRATIHWEELSRFTETFPEVQAERARQVMDGNRITCTGALAAFDTMMELIGEHHGAALRLEVAMLFMSPEATETQDPILARSKSVARAVAMMQANLEAPLPIAAVARQAGRSQKDLEARMKAELGATPQAVYRRLRLIHARKLVLETDLSVSEIALRCGYNDPSALTRSFKAEFGATPRSLRNS